MRPLEELSHFLQIVRPLTKSSSSITSLGQLSRIARVQDDKVRRVLARMAEDCNDKLVELKGRRYVLTAVGREVVAAGDRLLAAGQSQDTDSVSDVVTVELAPEIDFRYLVEPFRAFNDEFGGLVTVRLLPFDAEGIRGNLGNGITSFGLACVDAEGSDGAALLPRPVAWSVLVPGGHDLAEAADPVPAEGLVTKALVFVAAEFGERICAVTGGGTNIVVVPTPDAVRSAVAAGLGVGIDPDFCCYDEPEPYLRLSLAGVPALRLGLYLPRRPEQLSEAAKLLLDLIKAPRSEPAPVRAEAPPAESLDVPDAEPLSA